MIYTVIAVLIVFAIYAMSLVPWRKFKSMPDSLYKHNLWKFKKLELIEKAVICALFVLIAFSQNWFGEMNGYVTLAGVFGILIIEHFFGDWLRHRIVCPECKGPIWIGNFYVRLTPRQYCGHCGHKLYSLPGEITKQENDKE